MFCMMKWNDNALNFSVDVIKVMLCFLMFLFILYVDDDLPINIFSYSIRYWHGNIPYYHCGILVHVVPIGILGEASLSS